MSITTCQDSATTLEPVCWAEYCARDIMTEKVYTVPVDWKVQQLATFLVDHAISGAPVVDDEGQLLGVVSLTDIVGNAVDQQLDLSTEVADFYNDTQPLSAASREQLSKRSYLNDEVTVSDIMTPMVFDVRPDTPLQDVAEAMVRGRIHRVLVTEARHVRGIITALDLLRLQTLK